MKDLLRSVFGKGAAAPVQPTAPTAPVDTAAAAVNQAQDAAQSAADQAAEAQRQAQIQAAQAASQASATVTQAQTTATQAQAASDPIGGLGGILGGILGGAGGGVANSGTADLGSLLGGGGGLMALLPALLGLLGGSGGSKSGLESLLGGLHANGLSDVANSWVGSGPNQAISADQVEQSLGSDTVARLAQQAGVSPDEAKQGLASILPGLVDHLTSGGQLPDADSLEQALGGLRSQLPTG